MPRLMVVLVVGMACTTQPDPATFAADWLRQLAQGQTQTAYEKLCRDAQGQLASLAAQTTGESPQAFLARLKDRYGGVDRIDTKTSNDDGAELEIVTERARLPMRLKRIDAGFCVRLPEP